MHLPNQYGDQTRLAFGKFVASSIQQVGGAHHRRQWRTEFVADVCAEPALALHSRLHRFGHLVERTRDRVEVTVSGFLNPGAEVTAGDPLGAPGQASQRSQQSADGVTADQDTDQPGGHCLSREHPGADRHGLVEVLKGEHFDIHGVGQLHGNDEVRLATDLRPLLRPAFGGREIQ